MEKINIAELLKDCPTGMELDCTMYDNIQFDTVQDGNVYPIKINTPEGRISLSKYGCYSLNPQCKCVIFPKGKTTWEGFQRPFKDGDIVTWEDRGSLVACIYKERKNTASFNHHIALYIGSLGVVVNGEIALTDDELCIATEEEKQKLFDAIKSNGYKWDPKIKTLEKLPEFKAGDVLVSRAGNIVLCSNIDDNQVIHYHCILSPPNSFWIKNDIGVGKSFHCTLATDAEKQRLFDKLKSEGYKYNPQTNKLEKLIIPKFKVGDRIKEKKAYISGIITDISGGSYKVEYKNGGVAYANIEFQDNWELLPDKFDITTLKPFESRVLVRDYANQIWMPTFWGKYLEDDSNCSYLTTNGCYKYLIPYEGNQHLLGTTDDCNEYFKTWK